MVNTRVKIILYYIYYKDDIIIFIIVAGTVNVPLSSKMRSLRRKPNEHN